jgi:cyclophilin family peptidyl-prolyl cis-trans isomerase
VTDFVRFLGILTLAVFCSGSFSQDTGEKTPPPTAAADTSENPAKAADDVAATKPPASDEAKPDRAAFDTAVEKWQRVTAEYMDLALKWHLSEPSAGDRETRIRWGALQADSRQALNQAMEEAIKIVHNGLANHPDISVFLLRAVQYRSERDWYELSGEAIDALLKDETESQRLCGELGMDPKRLHAFAGLCLFMTGQFDLAEKYLALADAAGTMPEKYQGLSQALPQVKKHVEEELKQRQADEKSGDLPRVRFLTSRGPIVLELFEDQAPETVGNFISLVERGFYDDNPFYQVIAGTMAMAGDPLGDGTGEAGYHIADESNRPDARMVFRGSIAMAKLSDPAVSGNTLPNSASSQFLIGMAPLNLNKSQMSAFGRVIEGLDTIVALNAVKVDKEKGDKKGQKPPDTLFHAEVIRKRDHPYVPHKVELGPGHPHVH